MSHEIIVDMEEMMRNEPEQEANLRKWLLQYALPFTPDAKRQGGKKKKAIYGIREERTTIKEPAVPDIEWHGRPLVMASAT